MDGPARGFKSGSGSTGRDVRRTRRGGRAQAVGRVRRPPGRRRAAGVPADQPGRPVQRPRPLRGGLDAPAEAWIPGSPVLYIGKVPGSRAGAGCAAGSTSTAGSAPTSRWATGVVDTCSNGRPRTVCWSPGCRPARRTRPTSSPGCWTRSPPNSAGDRSPPDTRTPAGSHLTPAPPPAARAGPRGNRDRGPLGRSAPAAACGPTPLCPIRRHGQRRKCSSRPFTSVRMRSDRRGDDPSTPRRLR